MNIKDIKSVYFIGAGGIGMSALERYFLALGKHVGGYDRNPSELTNTLIKEGIKIHFEDSVKLIPEAFLDKATTLVVITPAVPADHKELIFFKEQGFEMQKRAQVLGAITHATRALCAAGTHGKTTTSTMAAHIMYVSHLGCTGFLGGISNNYHSNLILNETSPFTVIEADEFDRSFHWLRPEITIITSTDPDHLDIYGTKEAYLESFRHYTELIQPGGSLILHTNLEVKSNVQEGVKTYTYSRTEGDFHAENIKIGGGEIIFDLVTPTSTIKQIQLGVPVSINIDNSIAAMAMCLLAGATAEEVKEGIRTYLGVERRFDFKIKTPEKAFLSDYAHHPSEIRQSILSIRELYPGKKITAIFQPHLYTRTRDFYLDFANSLSLLDEVILTEIYPAREQPIPGITSEIIYRNLRPDMQRSICPKKNLLQQIETELETDILITLGAGDLDNYVPQITEILKKKW
ncbi:MAG: Mur ligase family protein [Bacteroidaceae bacterium]